MKNEHATFLYVTAFIDELVRAGLRHVVICPGSRSTPLAMSFARLAKAEEKLKLWMHIDERSAAFFALGMAKASGFPVALVCTSGTAAANFFPAVVEAHYGRVPLLVLTADRPPELREVGSPQTIDQFQLYGDHAKWFNDMPLPEGTSEMLRYARATASRAFAEAMGAPSGAVHLNFPFREPLVPIPPDEPIPDLRPDGQRYTQVAAGPRSLDPDDVARVAELLATKERGLILCGPAYRHDPAFPAVVTRLGELLGYPILADPLSGVRSGKHHRAIIIDAYDAFLRVPAFVEHIEPEVIIRFGAVPTSKPLVQYTQRYATIPQFVVDGGGAWNDATLRAAHMIHADSRRVCEGLLAYLSARADYFPLLADDGRERAWSLFWSETNRSTREAIAQEIANCAEPFEGRVFAELAELLPNDALLYASSSMPVRDMDTFFAGSERGVRFLANRGANGIDGVVSSALGAAAVSAEPLTLVIGDLAFYHDLNGLLAAKINQIRATIVVVNNDGGGIFSFLPQAAYPEHFEQLFGTPIGLDFRHAAALYGAHYTQAEDWEAFRSAFVAGAGATQLGGSERGLNIIEMRTDRNTNVLLHRRIWAAVAAALALRQQT